MTDETTTEQLAEIEGPAQYIVPEGWRVVPLNEPLKGGDEYHEGLDRYIRPIQSQPQPEPEKLPEGCRNDGGWSSGVNGTEPEPWPVPQPEPQPESDADLRIRLLKQANDSQAETIGRLLTEARDLNMEIGGLERRLSERDDRIRDLETIYSATTKSFEDANKANDALRSQVRILQQEADKKASRIEFLETLNAGNGAAIDNYRALVAKLQGLVDTARGQLEAAATERDELRAAIDQADKQLDQKDAQIRDLQIELDAAQQVPQPETMAATPPATEDRFEQGWDAGTARAVETIAEWTEPFRTCGSERLAWMVMQNLPHIMRTLTGLTQED